MMIDFKKRMAIENAFLIWCEENNVANKPNSFVAYMSVRGWLDEDKIEKDLKDVWPVFGLGCKNCEHHTKCADAFNIHSHYCGAYKEDNE